MRRAVNVAATVAALALSFASGCESREAGEPEPPPSPTPVASTLPPPSRPGPTREWLDIAVPAPPDIDEAPVGAQRSASGLVSKVLKVGTGRTHPGAQDLVKICPPLPRYLRDR